ncbi:hypothetical protein ACEUZ9_001057 [Paracoccus litorisediminis]|uniref:hypothetical protein n=1 Tax=Paracoccus litorisediminis TaxID=2006130 RepID=UPI003733E06F
MAVMDGATVLALAAAQKEADDASRQRYRDMGYTHEGFIETSVQLDNLQSNLNYTQSRLDDLDRQEREYERGKSGALRACIDFDESRVAIINTCERTIAAYYCLSGKDPHDYRNCDSIGDGSLMEAGEVEYIDAVEEGEIVFTAGCIEPYHIEQEYNGSTPVWKCV